MKWYGLKQSSDLQKNFVRNYKRRLNLKTRSLCMVLNFRVNYRYFAVSIFLPASWQMLRISNKRFSDHLIFCLFSQTYFCNFSFPNSYLSLKYDIRVHSINLLFKFYNNFFNLYWLFFRLAFYCFNQVFFNKLRFRGKGHYVYRNFRNSIAFQIGYSHRVRTFNYYIQVKLLSKITVFFFGLNKFDIIKASYKFFYKRPINIFTSKGVRFTRQAIYKKTGKISSYR